MAKCGFKMLGMGFWFDVTEKEAEQWAVPSLYVGVSALFWVVSVILIHHKVKKGIDSYSDSQKQQQDVEKTRIKAKIEEEAKIEKYKAIYELRKQYGLVPQDSELSFSDSDIQHWENYNDATYNHLTDKFQWLIGNVFLEGTINLVGGPKNHGKTPFITWICDAVSKGKSLDLFVSDRVNPCHQPPQPVYLYDFEMQYGQLNNRNGQHGYVFQNIKRETRQSYTVEEWLKHFETLTDGLTEKATIVVDNISRFNSDVTQPIVGKRLYDGIKTIRDKARDRGITITVILIANISNDKLLHKGITLKDFAVADTLTTGMDTICVLGPTFSENKKMLKILCNRHAPKPEFVTVLTAISTPFVRFEIAGIDKEENVLPQNITGDNHEGAGNDCMRNGEPKIKGQPLSIALEMEKMHLQGKSLRTIGEHFSISHTQVDNILKELKMYQMKHENDQADLKT